MKCNETDIIGYIEGKTTEETINHVRSCKKCSMEAEKLMRFSGLLSTYYARGKSLEKELDKRLASMDIRRMKKLPPDVAARITVIKGKSLTERLKKVVRRGKEETKALLGGPLSPQIRAMPASPKDITKTKKLRGKKKK